MTLLVDAGGTYLRYALEQKGMGEVHKIDSDALTLRELLELELALYPKIKSICISYAGQVRDGVILSAPNRKGDEGDIKSYFEKQYNTKLWIQNDLLCALLAEAKAHQSQDLCALYVGTGLGLGVMSASQVLVGVSNTATELGHIPYKKTPFVCGCGRDNCLELFASGSALARWKEYYALDETMDLLSLFHSQDPNAQKIYQEFEEALLYAMGTVITLFNPQKLVLGGGVFEKNSWLYERLFKKLDRYCFTLSLKACDIIESKLENAPLLGALELKGWMNG